MTAVVHDLLKISKMEINEDEKIIKFVEILKEKKRSLLNIDLETFMRIFGVQTLKDVKYGILKKLNSSTDYEGHSRETKRGIHVKIKRKIIFEKSNEKITHNKF